MKNRYDKVSQSRTQMEQHSRKEVVDVWTLFPLIKSVLVLLAILNFCSFATWGQSKSDAKPATTDEQTKKRLRDLGYKADFVDMLFALKPGSKDEFVASLVAMKQKKHELRTVTLKDKVIKFIPMVHGGQREFYEGVKASVVQYKKQGYTVYYEEVIADKNADSISNDIFSRKIRKMMGLSATRQTYAMIKMIDSNLVIQPAYDSLGITSSDINADVTSAQLVQQYEKLYGEVKLDSCDWVTPKSAVYYGCARLQNKEEPVILDFRNENLAEKIRSSPHSRILVLFGQKHIDGVMDLIR